MGLAGLLEQRKQRGSRWVPQEALLPLCLLGIISLWPEMTWPEQQGCQEDTAAGDRRRWLDKQVAAVVPILLEVLSHPRGHKHVAAVHPCPHSGCGPRRSGPDQLGHQLSSHGWSSILENLFPPLEQPCTVFYHMLRFFSWSPRRFQSWGL